jgi:hypothetical protein
LGQLKELPVKRSLHPCDEKLTPADPEDLAAALAFALKFEGRKRWHDADSFMADIVAKRLVRHLERAGFVHETSADRWWGGAWVRIRGLILSAAIGYLTGRRADSAAGLF